MRAKLNISVQIRGRRKGKKLGASGDDYEELDEEDTPLEVNASKSRMLIC
jgi:hypothetical protein